MAVMVSRKGRTRRSGLSLRRFQLCSLLCMTSACGGQGGLVSGAWCNQPDREWYLLVSTLAIGAIAAFVVWLVRERQLQRWDLRKSPVAPSTALTLWTIAGFAIIPAVLLSFSIYTADPCDPDQKSANVLYLWIGVVLGTAACLVGLLIAKTTYVKGSRR